MSANNILNTKFCFMTALTSVGNVRLWNQFFEKSKLNQKNVKLAYPALSSVSFESIFTSALSASRLINAVSVGITTSVISILTLIYVCTEP